MSRTFEYRGSGLTNFRSSLPRGAGSPALISSFDVQLQLVEQPERLASPA